MTNREYLAKLNDKELACKIWLLGNWTGINRLVEWLKEEYKE